MPSGLAAARPGPGCRLDPSLGARRGRFSELPPVLWYPDRHSSPKALAATRENKLGYPAAHHR